MPNLNTIADFNDNLPPWGQINQLGDGSITMGTITVNLETFQVNVNYIPYLEQVNNQLPPELRLTIRKVQDQSELWIGMYNLRRALNDYGALKVQAWSFIDQVNLYMYPSQRLQVYSKLIDGRDVVQHIRIFPNLFLKPVDNELLLAEEVVYDNPIDVAADQFNLPVLRNLMPPKPRLRQLLGRQPEQARQVSQEFTVRYETMLTALLDTTPLHGMPLQTDVPDTVVPLLQQEVRQALMEYLSEPARQELESYWPAEHAAPATVLTPTSHPHLYQQLVKVAQQPAPSSQDVLGMISQFLDSNDDVEALVDRGINALLGTIPPPYQKLAAAVLNGSLKPEMIFDFGLSHLPPDIRSIVDRALDIDANGIRFNPVGLLQAGIAKLDQHLPPLLQGALKIDSAGALKFDLEGVANRGINQLTGFLPPPLREAINIGLKDGRLDFNLNTQSLVNYGIGQLNNLLPPGMKLNLMFTDGRVTGIQIGPLSINLETGQAELLPLAKGLRIFERIFGVLKNMAEAPNVVTPISLPLDILQEETGEDPETDEDEDSEVPLKRQPETGLDLNRLPKVEHREDYEIHED